jgi:hypothetical protein
MKFIVNRAEAETKSFTQPGTYTVTIAAVKEAALDRNGDPVTTVTFRGDQGEVISDRYQAKPNQIWKLQKLVAVTALPIEDGEEFDFSRSGALTAFLTRFVNQRLTVTLETEAYTKKDGTEGSAMRIRGMAKAAAQVDEAY